MQAIGPTSTAATPASTLSLVRGLGPVDRSRFVQYRRLGSGCGRESCGTARPYPAPLRQDGAHSNAIIGQEYHSPGFERASDGAYGCRSRHTTLELEVVDVAFAHRRGARQPADGPAQQSSRRAALGGRDHHSFISVHHSSGITASAHEQKITTV